MLSHTPLFFNLRGCSSIVPSVTSIHPSMLQLEVLLAAEVSRLAKECAVVRWLLLHAIESSHVKRHGGRKGLHDPSSQST